MQKDQRTIELDLIKKINEQKELDEMLIFELAAYLSDPKREKECFQQGSFGLNLDSKCSKIVAQTMLKGTVVKEFWLARSVDDGRAEFIELVRDMNVSSVCYNPDSSLVVVASDDGSVELWSTQDTLRTKKQQLHDKEILDNKDSLWQAKAVFSHDGTQIAFTTPMQECFVYASDYSVPKWKGKYGSLIGDISFSQDDSLIAMALYEPHLCVGLAKAATGELKRVLLNQEEIRCLTCADSSNLLACAGNGIALWDMHVGQKLHDYFDMHKNHINELRFNKESFLLATASKDDSARISDVRNRMQNVQSYKHQDRVTSLSFHPDGVTIATASDKRMRSWDLRTGKLLMEEMAIDTDPITCVRWNNNGTQLATASGKSAKLWRMGDTSIRKYLDTDLIPESAALLSSIANSVELAISGKPQNDVYPPQSILHITKQMPSALEELVKLEMNLEN